MKRLLIFFLTFALVIQTMTACGGVSTPTEGSSVQEEPTNTIEFESATIENDDTGSATEEPSTDEAISTETEIDSEPITEEPSDSEDESVTENTTEVPNIPDEPEPSEEPTPEPSEPEHEHTYSVTVVSPTCTEKGYTIYTCSCGDTYKDSSVKATGHKYGAWETTKQPTTTSKGESKRVCSRCGKTETKELDKISGAHTHSYSKEVVAPTCIADGYTIYTCSCGDSYTADKTTTALHDLYSYYSPATCEHDGRIMYTCRNCGATFADGHVVEEKLDHNYEEIGRTTGNCLHSFDSITYRCVNCGGEETKWTYVQERRHQEGEAKVLKEPTCTSTGEGAIMCELCDCQIKKTTIPAKGHAAFIEGQAEPLCGVTGFIREECRVCGTTVSNTRLPATGGCVYSTQNLAEMAELNYQNRKKARDPSELTSAYAGKDEHCVQACERCGNFDPDTIQSIYGTAYEECIYLMEMINEYRREYFGTDKYDLQFDTDLYILAAFRAVESYEGSDVITWTNATESKTTKIRGLHKYYDYLYEYANGLFHNKNYKYFAFAPYYAKYSENKHLVVAWTPMTLGCFVSLAWTEEDRDYYYEVLEQVN